MDQYSQLTSQYIQQRFKLPKIAAQKIQQANRFINNPNSVIKLILDRSSYQENSSDKIKQNPHTSRVQKHMKRTSTLEQQNHVQPERHLISVKMKKFRPVNGSFSQFYGEQLSIDTNRSKRSHQKNHISELNIPKLLLGKIQNQNEKPRRSKRNYLQKTLSTQVLCNPGLHSHNKQFQYMQKLRQIQDTSQQLRQNSRHLLRMADSQSELSKVFFEKIKDDSNRILTGEQKYNFDQQLTTAFNKNFSHPHKKWNSRR